MRGMPEDRRQLGPPAGLRRVRPRRVLRQFPGQARHQAFPQDAARDHAQLRARRGLGLVLRGRSLPGAGPAATLKVFQRYRSSLSDSATVRAETNTTPAATVDPPFDSSRVQTSPPQIAIAAHTTVRA